MNNSSICSTGNWAMIETIFERRVKAKDSSTTWVAMDFIRCHLSMLAMKNLMARMMNWRRLRRPVLRKLDCQSAIEAKNIPNYCAYLKVEVISLSRSKSSFISRKFLTTDFNLSNYHNAPHCAAYGSMIHRAFHRLCINIMRLVLI